MSSTSASKIENPAPQSRIIEAYNYFIDHIDENKLNIMTVMMNAQFVRIDLNADEDEQQIFNTINSLGVNLTTSELLKNYFFSRDTISEYEAKWAAVFEKDDDAKSYWDTEIETGRMKRAVIDIFFDSFFQLFIQDKQYNISNDDKIMYGRVDSLAQSYQHFIDHYCNGDKSIILNQMKDYAVCFRNTFRPETCSTSIPSTFGIERLNIVIFGLKTSTLIPYMLYIAKNSLEHLMPKKWRNNWPACATDDLAKQRDSKLLTLGNLAIIPQALNASIRDSDWVTKKSGKGVNKPGLEACAKGLITLNTVLLESEWSEQCIDIRANWLFKIAKELWKI